MKGKPVIKALAKIPQSPWSHLSRESVTKRFMHAIDHIIMYRRKDCKNYSHVAKAIGMPQQNLSKFNNGLQDATVEQIARLCDHFGINDAYILRGVGNLEEMMPTNQRIDKIEAQVIELQKRFDLMMKKK